MTIFISLTILFGIGLFLSYKDKYGVIGKIGEFVAITSGPLLLSALVLLIINSIEVKSNINKFLATKTTIETARKEGTNIESAVIKYKIIKSNQWLAKEQYYNTTIFRLWIPDEVDVLKPIK